MLALVNLDNLDNLDNPNNLNNSMLHLHLHLHLQLPPMLHLNDPNYQRQDEGHRVPTSNPILDLRELHRQRASPFSRHHPRQPMTHRVATATRTRSPTRQCRRSSRCRRARCATF